MLHLHRLHPQYSWRCDPYRGASLETHGRVIRTVTRAAVPTACSVLKCAEVARFFRIVECYEQCSKSGLAI